MNTYLLELFDKYNISDRDRYEIQQIFMFLPDEKKKKLLDNFAVLAGRLVQIEQEIELERELLIWWIVKELKERVEEQEKERINKIRSELDVLKEETR